MENLQVMDNIIWSLDNIRLWGLWWPFFTIFSEFTAQTINWLIEEIIARFTVLIISIRFTLGTKWCCTNPIWKTTEGNMWRLYFLKGKLLLHMGSLLLSLCSKGPYEKTIELHYGKCRIKQFWSSSVFSLLALILTIFFKNVSPTLCRVNSLWY